MWRRLARSPLALAARRSSSYSQPPNLDYARAARSARRMAADTLMLQLRTARLEWPSLRRVFVRAASVLGPSAEAGIASASDHVLNALCQPRTHAYTHV